MWGPLAVTELAAPVAQLAGRLRVEGEGGHGGRFHAAVLDQVAEALGEDPGLPRTRRGDDPCTARRDVPRPPAGPGRGRPRVGGRRRATVTPPPCSSGARRRCHREVAGERTVPRRRTAVCRHPARCRLGPPSLTPSITEAPGGLASVPPDRLSAAGVVGVGPDEELEALPGELEAGAEVVHRLVAHLGFTQRLSGRRPTPRPPAGDRTTPGAGPPARRPGR